MLVVLSRGSTNNKKDSHHLYFSARSYLIFPITLTQLHYLPYFAEEETEALRGLVTCLILYIQNIEELELKPHHVVLTLFYKTFHPLFFQLLQKAIAATSYIPVTVSAMKTYSDMPAFFSSFSWSTIDASTYRILANWRIRQQAYFHFQMLAIHLTMCLVSVMQWMRLGLHI